jgi:hypothetical protein
MKRDGGRICYNKKPIEMGGKKIENEKHVMFKHVANISNNWEDLRPFLQML